MECFLDVLLLLSSCRAPPGYKNGPLRSLAGILQPATDIATEPIQYEEEMEDDILAQPLKDEEEVMMNDGVSPFDL